MRQSKDQPGIAANRVHVYEALRRKGKPTFEAAAIANKGRTSKARSEMTAKGNRKRA